MYLDRNKCAGTVFPFNAGAFHFFVVAVLANVGLVRAIFCKYSSKNGPNLRFCCRTCGKCGSQSLCVQVRHKKNDPQRDGYESFLIFPKRGGAQKEPSLLCPSTSFRILRGACRPSRRVPCGEQKLCRERGWSGLSGLS